MLHVLPILFSLIWSLKQHRIWWEVTKCDKILITQFSPPSCYFLYLMSEHSPQYCLLRQT
jgi:hypothetical protein